MYLDDLFTNKFLILHLFIILYFNYYYILLRDDILSIMNLKKKRVYLDASTDIGLVIIIIFWESGGSDIYNETNL